MTREKKEPKVSPIETYCQHCALERGGAGIYRVSVFTDRGALLHIFERLCSAHTMRQALPLPGRQVLIGYARMPLDIGQSRKVDEGAPA